MTSVTLLVATFRVGKTFLKTRLAPLSSEEFDQSLDALWIVRTELRVVELKLCKSRAGCIEDQRVTSSDSLEVPHTHDKLYLLLINLQIIFRRVETGN